MNAKALRGARERGARTPENAAKRCPVSAKGDAGEQDRSGQELVGVENLLHPGNVDEAEHIAAATVALDILKTTRNDHSRCRSGRPGDRKCCNCRKGNRTN